MTREERLAYLRTYAAEYRQANKTLIKAKRQAKTAQDKQVALERAKARQAIKDEIRATKLAIIARRHQFPTPTNPSTTTERE